MARYGLNRYSTTTYGEPSPSQFAVDLIVREHNYASSRISLSQVPTGNYQAFAIIRSSVGYPAFVEDGVPLYVSVVSPTYRLPETTGTPADQIAYDIGVGKFPLVDWPLPTGRFTYYSAFVYVAADGEWVKVAQERVLIPSFYDGKTNLYQAIPPIFRTDFQGAVDDVNYLDNPQLESFLGIFGFQGDILRSYTAQLTHVHDPYRMEYDLVASALADFGTPFEEALGPEQMRRFLANQMHFYRTKGTLECARGVSVAVTGYNAEVTTGTNVLWSTDFTSAAGTVALWQCDSTQWAVVQDPDYVLDVGGESLTAFHIQSNGNTTPASANFFTGPVTDPSLGVPSLQTRESAYPVLPGQVIGVGATFYGVLGTVAAKWLDVSGHPLVINESGTTSTNVHDGDRVSDVFTAPENAAFVQVGVSLQGLPTNGSASPARWSAVALTLLQYDTDDVPAYESPRKVHVHLVPPRVNLVSNPSFEDNLDNWQQVGDLLTFDRDTTVRDTVFPNSALASASLQATSAITSQSPPQFVYTVMQTRAGTRYAVRVRSQRTEVSDVINYSVDAFDGQDVSGTPLGGMVVAGGPFVAFADVPRWSFVATSAETYLVVQVNEASANDQINIDSCLVEQWDRPLEDMGIYFDGDNFTVFGEYLWTGDETDSASMYFPQRTVRAARLTEILPRYLPFGTDFDLSFGLPQIRGFADPVKVLGQVPGSVATTDVGKSIKATWENYVDNGVAISARYDIDSHVGASITAEWNDKAHVHADITARYNDLHSVGTSITGVWNVAPLASVGTSITGLWNDAAPTSSYFNEVMADNPFAYWRMDDPASIDGVSQGMVDSSGNGRNASVNASAYQQPPLGAGLGPSMYFNGGSGKNAYYYDPNNSGARFPSTPSWSFEMILQPHTLRSGSPNGIWQLGLEGGSSDGNIGVRSSDNGKRPGEINVTGNRLDLPSGDDLQVGVTTHLVLDCDTSTGKTTFYKDGVAVGVYGSETVSDVDFAWPWNYSNGRQMDCYISDMVIYQHALGAARVQSHYNAALPPSAPNAPTAAHATANSAAAIVGWTAPGYPGSSPITGYTVITSPADVGPVTVGNVLSTTITGLTNGTAYTFTVKAINAVGTSVPSAPSAAVTPSAVTRTAPTVESFTDIGNNSSTVVTPGSGLDHYIVVQVAEQVSGGPLTATATVDGVAMPLLTSGTSDNGAQGSSTFGMSVNGSSHTVAIAWGNNGRAGLWMLAAQAPGMVETVAIDAASGAPSPSSFNVSLGEGDLLLLQTKGGESADQAMSSSTSQLHQSSGGYPRNDWIGYFVPDAGTATTTSFTSFNGYGNSRAVVSVLHFLPYIPTTYGAMPYMTDFHQQNLQSGDAAYGDRTNGLGLPWATTGGVMGVNGADGGAYSVSNDGSYGGEVRNLLETHDTDFDIRATVTGIDSGGHLNICLIARAQDDQNYLQATLTGMPIRSPLTSESGTSSPI